MRQMRILRKKIGAEPQFFLISIFLIFIIILSYIFGLFNFEINTILLHISIFLLGYSFIFRKSNKQTIKHIIQIRSIKEIVIYVVFGFFALIFYLFLLNLIFGTIGLNDSDRVIEKIEMFTIPVIFAALFLGPISEEIFFREFLTNRIGIIPSSLMFGIAHIAYGSIAQIIGAVGIGIILAYVLKKSGSVLPCILIHFLYNLFVFSLFWWFV